LAANQRQYTAIFSIGGRLLGSFSGAMAKAQARLHGLQTTALAVGRSVTHLAGAMLSLGGVLGGLAAGKIFHTIFGEAIKEAQAVDDRTRALRQSLMATNKVRAAAAKAGVPTLQIADEQLRLMREQWEQMGKNRVVSEEMYDISAAILAKQGILPKNLVETNKQLAKMVVYMKGVSATEEDMAEMAFRVGKAIHGVGRGRELFMLGIPGLNKEALKDFQALTSDQARYNFLMERFKRIQDFNAEASATGFGKLKILNNEMRQMAIRIGHDIEPALGQLADTWREVLRELEPYIRGFIKLAVQGFIWLAKQIHENAIPALRDFLAWVKENQTWLVPLAKDLAIATAVFVGLGVAVYALGTAFAVLSSPVTWIALLISGIVLLVRHWDDIEKMWPAVATFSHNFQQAWIDMADKLDRFDKALKPFVETFKQSFVDLYNNLAWFDNATKPYIDRFRENFMQGWRDLGTNIGKGAKAVGEGAKAVGGAIGATWKEIFTNTEAAHGLPPGFLSAVAKQENVNPAYNNPLGLSGAGGPYRYPTPAAGAAAVEKQARLITNPTGPYRDFVRSGYKDIDAFARVWSPVGAANDPYGTNATEASGIRSAMRTMPPPQASTTSTVHFAPNITIHGDATEAEQKALDARLRDLSRTFIDDWEEAQNQSRRLSYQGGY
jgi:hypothetical protein